MKVKELSERGMTILPLWGFSLVREGSEFSWRGIVKSSCLQDLASEVKLRELSERGMKKLSFQLSHNELAIVS